ncbi:hypothetical protein SAMN04488156_104286 [Bacillus sp. 166amftsu]|nr:hypothetical protein SAMN04488156_104286 [Bacillus sp. 166amftsu]
MHSSGQILYLMPSEKHNEKTNSDYLLFFIADTFKLKNKMYIYYNKLPLPNRKADYKKLQSAFTYFLLYFAINSESFFTSSSVPLNTPLGIAPFPSFAIFAISSGFNVKFCNAGAAAPPCKLSP